MTLCACAWAGEAGTTGAGRAATVPCALPPSPGEVMGKKQVVSEPQVLLSRWEFSLLLSSRSAFEGLRVVVSRWVRWFIFAGLLKYQEDGVPLSEHLENSSAFVGPPFYRSCHFDCWIPLGHRQCPSFVAFSRICLKDYDHGLLNGTSKSIQNISLWNQCLL